MQLQPIYQLGVGSPPWSTAPTIRATKGDHVVGGITTVQQDTEGMGTGRRLAVQCWARLEQWPPAFWAQGAGGPRGGDVPCHLGHRGHLTVHWKASAACLPCLS
jgi:hypothetical protein